MKLQNFILIFALILIFSSINSYSYEECDSLRWCVGRSLKLQVTQGKGAHYVDVDKSSALARIDTAISVEFWIKAQRQSGKKQFIAGIWGPAEDKNDVWTIYIDEKDSLIFEINGFKGRQGAADNTIASTSATGLYNKWTHITCVFDGNKATASIFINGIQKVNAYNPAFPAKSLNTPENDELSVQIGSTNALLNDLNLNRTLLGELDEFRIWSKTLNSNDLLCLKDVSLAGNEKNLVLYYRFNSEPSVFVMCDATPNHNTGYARSGAYCDWSDRGYDKGYIVSAKAINDTLYCDSRKEYVVQVTDTSICGTRVRLAFNNKQEDNEFFSFSIAGKTYTSKQGAWLDLSPRSSNTFSIIVDGNFTGTINTVMELRNINACNWKIIDIPISITRVTELSYSTDEIKFDSLIARCIEKPYIDSTIRICNNTNKSGAAKPIVISSISTSFPQIFSLIGASLPDTLQANECKDYTIRFYSADSTMFYQDTLKVYSNDKCQALRLIPISGKVNEAIKVTDNSFNRLDSIDFGKICVDFASDAIEYYWENNLGFDIRVDSIIVPDQFISKPLRFPITLTPATGYRPNYFRFLPTKAGIYNDSIIFIVNAGGCTIRKPIYIKATGFSADIVFEADTVDFGTVVVGRELTIQIKTSNLSKDFLNASYYLKLGNAFFLNGAKGAGLNPNGGNAFIPVTFKPTVAGDFEDFFCFFEQKCYGSKCIIVKGKGIIQEFEYNPALMQIANVLGCDSKNGKISIKNVSGNNLTLTNFNLKDPANRFTLVNPISLPSSLNLSNNQSFEFEFKYTPNDLNIDRADKAFLEYKTSSPDINWSVILLGSSVVPKLSSDETIMYETIEVGETRLDTVTIENIANVPIILDSLSIGDGFRIVKPTLKNFTFAPGQRVEVVIEFVPSQAKDYYDSLSIYASSPCIRFSKTNLIGKGILVPLEVPLNVISFGYSMPCDCIRRELILVNRSFVHDMSIDSIWIDTSGIANAYPQYFTWKSTYYKANSNKMPYIVPPTGKDTLEIFYCPRAILDRNYINHAARINIKANGSGWNNTYSTYISGKQSLIFEFDSSSIYFPPTPVDTFSISKIVNLWIPESDVNPRRDNIKIDSIQFIPDERVFYADIISPSTNLPIEIDTSSAISMRLRFKPRSVRQYDARMKIFFSKPCQSFDTTITLSGSGFAPAFGLKFNFDTRNRRDTIRAINCDTIRIPVYSSRQLPARIVDINYYLKYDTSKYMYAGTDSDYLSSNCLGYFPNITVSDATFLGKEIRLKNFCSVDSLKPIATHKLLSKLPIRDTFSIDIDSIRFDSEDVIYYHLIAEGDDLISIILKPEITITNRIDYDTVRVMDCKIDSLIVKNIGDVDISNLSSSILPNSVKLINSIPKLDSIIAPNDSVIIYFQYCPRKNEQIIDSIQIYSNLPCSISSNYTPLNAIGYAPPYPISNLIIQNLIIKDSLSSYIGDTLKFELAIDKDLSTNLQNTTYWIEDLDFKYELIYDKKSLMYLNYQNILAKNSNEIKTDSSIIVNFESIDSLRSGQAFARFEFLSVVPLQSISNLTHKMSDFNSDSILFYDLQSKDTIDYYICLGKCNIKTVSYTGIANNDIILFPNPSEGNIQIEILLAEKSLINLEIYDINGNKLDDLILPQNMFEPGKYEISTNLNYLQSGVYSLIMKIDDNKYLSKPLIIIK